MTNHPNRNKTLAQWADVRKTSIEIARCIRDMARNRLDSHELDELWDDMQRIWEEPTQDEIEAIERAAFEATDEDKLFWGVTTIRREAVAHR